MNAAKTLNLIATNSGRLSAKGHAILNAGIAECLLLGWVRHTPKKAIAYELTDLGKAAMSSMRTGIPLPVKTSK